MFSEISQLQRVKSSMVTPVRMELKEVETEKEARRTAAAMGGMGYPGRERNWSKGIKFQP